jgi:hypothetical protein
MAELRPQLAQMEKDQVATQAKLADFPRYRVVSGGAMTLEELQKVLREGEAYYKMTMVGDDAYGIFATPTTARTFRLALGQPPLRLRSTRCATVSARSRTGRSSPIRSTSSSRTSCSSNCLLR